MGYLIPFDIHEHMKHLKVSKHFEKFSSPIFFQYSIFHRFYYKIQLFVH